MKKLLSLCVASALLLPAAVFAQSLKIGTVDMQRAFKEYTKTKDAEAKINDAKNAAKKEYDDRADSYKKALDKVNNLNKQLESRPLGSRPPTLRALGSSIVWPGTRRSRPSSCCTVFPRRRTSSTTSFHFWRIDFVSSHPTTRAWDTAWRRTRPSSDRHLTTWPRPSTRS